MSVKEIERERELMTVETNKQNDESQSMRMTYREKKQKFIFITFDQKYCEFCSVHS